MNSNLLKIEILEKQKEDLLKKIEILNSQVSAIDNKIGKIQHWNSQQKPREEKDNTNK